MLIDTHCHLNDPAFRPSFLDVLSRAREAGVSAFIVPAYGMESLERTAELASAFPGIIFPAFGIHPWHVHDGIDYEKIFSYVKRKNTVAIGEIGLDFSPECPPQGVQMDALARQIQWARDLDLPVSIHCRKAHEALLQILAGHGGKVRGAMHSFSGNKDLMSTFVDLGFYISFAGSVTRKNARKYHRNAQTAPIDRLLLETDAPSIATETTQAADVEPRHLVEVALKVAELRGVSLEDISLRTSENVRRLFCLK